MFGDLLFNSVDEFARTTEARQRGFCAAEPVDVLVERRVETQHVAQLLLKVTLQTHRAPANTPDARDNYDLV